MALRESIQLNNQVRYNNAVLARDKRVQDNYIRKQHEEFSELLSVGETQYDERAIAQSGMIARVFDENPFTGFANVVSRPENGIKSYGQLTTKDLADLPTHQVRQVMANSNPQVSAAITDFQEYVKPGWDIYPESHPILDRWFDDMGLYDVSIDGFIDQISESMFLHGAYFYESAYEDDIPKRLVGLDPYSAVYKRSESKTGQFFELGQRQRNEPFVSLHFDPTIEYKPLYAQVGNPYGKPLVDAALFHLIMVVEFFKSYQQVLQTLVWPALLMRIDREVIAEMVKTESKRGAFVTEVLAMLKKELEEMGPGKVLSYGSEVMEPELLSGMNKANLGGVPDFIDILDRQIMMALKSNQLLFSGSDSFTETRAMYEMNHYALLINHAQTSINESMTRQCNIALMRSNINQLVEFRLRRSIFEEEKLLAGINIQVQQANMSFDNSMLSLNMWLTDAVNTGRMSEAQAQEYWEKERDRRRGQMIFKNVK